MLKLDEFRERMKLEVKRSKEAASVQASGTDLEDALQKAAIELGLPVHRLDYEILDRGNRGILGMKKRPCLIIAYETEKSAAGKTGIAAADVGDLAGQEDIIPADGRFSLRLTASAAWVKIFPPVGDGEPVSLEEVTATLEERGIRGTDVGELTDVLEKSNREWRRVGEYTHNPVNDALLSLDVTSDEMKAYIVVTPPGPGGNDLTVMDIEDFLKSNGIGYGIQKDALQEFEDFPVYQTAFLVAEGTPAVRGQDARIIYNFETQLDKITLHERSDGSVDYKELDKYQNVVKGQPLARKTELGSGKEGRTVYGRFLPTEDGDDMDFVLGKNVTVIDDGSTVVAAVSGHVLLKNGAITVETVLVITGNVGAKTGNVNVLSSVEITGNVEDGYSVSAQGRIQVAGYVSRANLNAEGDIVVSRGINGGEGGEFGHISAGGTVWSSYIQNAQVQAGEFVIVGAGIVNCHIMAQKKVLCKGGRAKIVGGHVHAAEEINAVILGSPGGAETILEVGYDPETKKVIEELKIQDEQLNAELEIMDRNLQGLSRQVKTRRRKLSQEKAKLFKELQHQHKLLTDRIKEVEEDLKKKREYLESLRLEGRISSSRKTLAGVLVRIREKEYRITDPYEVPVTFILEDEFIRPVKYQEIQEDLSKR